jgi:ribosomal protein L11 methyltransferase
VTDWIEVRALFDTAPEDWSLFADAFDRFGCPSSVQQDRPPSISGYLTEVEGSTAHAEELREELLRLGVASVELATVPDEDWSELWKIHFKPRLVGEKIWIRPTWEDAPAEPGQIEIVLDPGQAFGTGDHPTTRVCLQMMERFPLAGKSVYDLGCGSGILAIAAVKLGAEPVLASDIDPISVAVTRENTTLNGVSFPVSDGAGFVGEMFDVVISNIISATLIRLAPEAADHVKPGGLWIVSGIIQSNWPDVRAAAERAGFTFLDRVEEDEWVGAAFRR